jgi:hypothetical protein
MYDALAEGQATGGTFQILYRHILSGGPPSTYTRRSPKSGLTACYQCRKATTK